MDVIITIFSLIAFLFSVIIHELAHGYVAYSLGDATAKYEGRLSLNPLRHLDLFGSFILPLFLYISNSPFLFGWAKPVPINPYNFRDQKWGALKVAIAGPISNFSIAIVFGIIIRFCVYFQIYPLVELFGIVVYLNILLGLFNLIPIPPLDGSWILFRFFPYKWEGIKIMLQQYGFFILIIFIMSGGFDKFYSLINSLFFIFTGIPS